MQFQILARHARTVILAMAVMLAVVSGALLPGHNTASAGGACDAYAGKELYNCLATKLETVSSYGAARSPETQAALQKAASQLRVATNKAQALSAISQCRSVVNGIFQRIKFASQDTGLSAVTAALAYAARMIQAKG